ncbi:heme utilization cystosolic carrier protein HutX [Azospirillum sp. BE72]|uniref:heme utilization cystosolic carrier protein HutX n=1 Tax=Azospirillum sp. BE72 TaxID=2817776 RepID=UPI00285E9F99|nr:heme utilization cystosolic carrier protein HutX [Azospirillum sp. BE72]MDR6772221.1 putative heme utilization carrier protein HutX [Azospirillum sp. BE72]
MTAQNTPAASQDAAMESLRARLLAEPGGVLEAVAAETGVSLRTVVDCLPAAMRGFAPGSAAEAAMTDIAGWGPITFLVHSADLVLECKGPLPLGQFGRGFYNLAGGSPIGGHIRLDRCADLAFVRRPFMGSGDSCAVIFFNGDGEAMFKIFVGRDEKRQLLADQVDRFLALRNRLCLPAA